ncbi:MAG: S24 family peptidase [Patescibacteria group bacterium]
MNNQLHPTQQKLLNLLKENIDDPLTIRELQEEIGVSSPSVIYHHIQQLEKMGYLRRNPYNPRDYQVLADSPDKKIAYLNLYGLAQCGPNGSILDGNPIERVPVSTKLIGFSSVDAFLVKAKGDSMSPKINEGDIIIAKKSDDADSGSLVVCVNNGQALIKKYQPEKNGIILGSINQKYPPFIASENFKIEGIIKGIITFS